MLRITAVAAVSPGKRDGIGGETFLVIATSRHPALRRAVLPERRKARRIIGGGKSTAG
jgi:hypothetical protein